MRGFDLLGQQVALQMGVAAFRVRLRVIEDHTVMPACEAGDRVHVRVGQQLRPCVGIELAADVAELLARVKVKVDLAIAQKVLHKAGQSCGL